MLDILVTFQNKRDINTDKLLGYGGMTKQKKKEKKRANTILWRIEEMKFEITMDIIHQINKHK